MCGREEVDTDKHPTFEAVIVGIFAKIPKLGTE